MPEIITFMSPKGGSGATFVCAGVWATLCEKSYKVLAFDACFEKGALDYALGFKSDYVYTMTDVADGNCSLKDAMVSFGSGSFLRADYENNFFETEAAFEILIAVSFMDVQNLIIGFLEGLYIGMVGNDNTAKSHIMGILNNGFDITYTIHF